MCGIVGMLGGASSETTVATMIGALKNRGPDGRGVWTDRGAGFCLGHVRLAIIDISERGLQPMISADGRHVLAFNGEIYNFLEIRRELEQAGVKLHSTSDTEVLLEALAHWGVGVVSRLRGMFAFALWDRVEKTLCLVRDRLGIKPLLYTNHNQTLYFASELKAIAVGTGERRVDPGAVVDLLSTGAICQPRTMLQEVRHVLPGTILIFKPGQTPQTQRYWDMCAGIADRRAALAGCSYEQLRRALRSELEQAVDLHQIGDVRIGSFLSGGVDSSAVTALMAKRSNSPIASFTLGFRRSADVEDETGLARIAADAYGCEYHQTLVGAEQIEAYFDDFLDAIDQPSHDGANTYFVSQSVRGVAKVVLSGLGADELFGGYPHFERMNAGSAEPRIYDPVLARLHRVRPTKYTQIAALRMLPPARKFSSLRRFASDAVIRAARAPGRGRPSDEQQFNKYVSDLICPDLDPITQTSIFECQHYLLNTLLRDADVLSMHFGIELRPVFIDHKIVEFALALPPEVKVHEGRKKRLLVDACRDLIPAEILNGKKRGFELPVLEWLRGPLRGRFEAVLEGDYAKEWFARPFLAEIRRSLDEITDYRLHWTVFVMLSWMVRNKVDVR